MEKKELNLEELNAVNGGTNENDVCLTIIYKDNIADTDTKTEYIYMSELTALMTMMELKAKTWCQDNGKIFVSFKVVMTNEE